MYLVGHALNLRWVLHESHCDDQRSIDKGSINVCRLGQCQSNTDREGGARAFVEFLATKHARFPFRDL